MKLSERIRRGFAFGTLHGVVKGRMDYSTVDEDHRLVRCCAVGFAALDVLHEQHPDDFLNGIPRKEIGDDDLEDLIDDTADHIAHHTDDIAENPNQGLLDVVNAYRLEHEKEPITYSDIKGIVFYLNDKTDLSPVEIADLLQQHGH